MSCSIRFRIKGSGSGFHYNTETCFGGFDSLFQAKTCAIGWYLLHINKESFMGKFTGHVDIYTTNKDSSGDFVESIESFNIEKIIQEAGYVRKN